MVAAAEMKLTVLMLLASQWVSSLMVAGLTGMMLTGVDTLGLTGCKFSDGGWSRNEADSLDTLGMTESKFSDGGCS